MVITCPSTCFGRKLKQATRTTSPCMVSILQRYLVGGVSSTRQRRGRLTSRRRLEQQMVSVPNREFVLTEGVTGGASHEFQDFRSTSIDQCRFATNCVVQCERPCLASTGANSVSAIAFDGNCRRSGRSLAFDYGKEGRENRLDSGRGRGLPFGRSWSCNSIRSNSSATSVLSSAGAPL